MLLDNKNAIRASGIDHGAASTIQVDSGESTMPDQPRYATIDDYIASASPDVRDILEEIRRIVKSVAPDLSETISYQLPAFKAGRVFIYFAAFKRHIGIYPPVRGDDELQTRLLPYRGEKGNLKLPLNEPMPFDLIRDVVKALYKENSRRTE